jgi:hypothetical protein
MPDASDYEFEKLVEDAVESILGGEGLTVNKQRGNTNLKTPRVEVQFVLGGVKDGSQDGNPTDGFYFYRFTGRLTVATVTDRGRNGEEHPGNVGKVRKALANRGAFTPTNLPGLTIDEIKLAGSDPSIDSENNLDVTADSYDIVFAFTQ